MDIAIIAVGVFVAGITALLEPLAPASAAAVIGAVIWRYHRTASVQHSTRTRRASLLVASAVALAAAASG